MLHLGGGGDVVTSLLQGSLIAAGHTVTIAARNASSTNVLKAVEELPALKVASVVDGIKGAEITFLVTPFNNNFDALTPEAIAALEGKILVDCTNPVGAGFSHPLGNKSGTEVLQEALPKTHVVKAYSIMAFDHMEKPSFPGYGSALPLHLIAGNDPASKKVVTDLIAPVWRLFSLKEQYSPVCSLAGTLLTLAMQLLPSSSST